MSYENSPLGKKSNYIDLYDKKLLFPISRKESRAKIGINDKLPFWGFDIWTAYEISFLDEKGKPIIGIANIVIPCDSPNIIESKSLKLYLNSFNNSKFESIRDVLFLLRKDLSLCCDYVVDVKASAIEENNLITKFSGKCLDYLEINIDEYTIKPELLKIDKSFLVKETVYSNLLKSNCPVTGQPDFGSIQIEYTGFYINEESLLKYIISYREHNEFHEQCCERIFMDLMNYCNPQELTVYTRYTRRGGLDINPIRSTKNISPPKNIRLFRQ